MRTRRRPVWRPGPWLALGLLVVLAAGGLPLGWMFVLGLRDAPALAAALASAHGFRLLVHTALLGLLVAAITAGLGTVFGFLIAKTDLPGRALLAAVLTLPLFLPPYTVAAAWFAVLGREGLVAAAFGSAVAGRTSDLFFGLGGATLVLTIAYTPVAVHLVWMALHSIDPALEEAARLRFRWPRVLARVDLPLAAPAIALAMLVAFVLVVGEQAVPAYLRYPVFATEAFTQFAAFLDIRAAVALSMPLGLLVLGGVVLERYGLRDRFRPLTRLRPGGRLRASLGGMRILCAAAAWTYALVTVVLPIIALGVRARGAESYATAIRGAGASLWQSAWTAAVAATAMLGLGLVLGYLIERSGRRRRDGLDTLLLLLFAAPGTVLGIGLVLLGARAGLAWLSANAAIILVGYVGHVTPLASRTAGVGLASLAAGVEEPARLAGVPWFRTLRHVVVPPARPALAAAWLLAFVFCLRDLDLVITIYPPGAETLPVRAYTLAANSPEPVTAALNLLMFGLSALTLSVAATGVALVRRRSSAWR